MVHHSRKTSKDMATADLGSCKVETWLQEMEGPRAWVNQTDVRIAIAQGNSEPTALEMKWSRRVHRDAPVLSLERVFGENDQPAGYKRLTGFALLRPEKRAVYERLARNSPLPTLKRRGSLADWETETTQPISSWLRATNFALLRSSVRGAGANWHREPVDLIDVR